MIFKSGHVALIGRPNSGKSTLLNHLVGEKLAAVSNKPQTTRTRIIGIVTYPDEGQIIFVDTPGVHKPGYSLNRRMMQLVHDSLATVDIRLLMVDVTAAFGKGEQFTLDLIKQAEGPAFLLLNKIDLLKDKKKLFAIIEHYSKEFEFAEVIPISARTGNGCELLAKKLLEHLPEGAQVYAADDMTTQPARNHVAELVREKVLRVTDAEVPYSTAVITELFEEHENLVRIFCAILVERDSQKSIIIGRGGERLKQIGTAARQDIEKLLGKKIYLELFVKVQPNWRDDERLLDELGVERVSE